MSFFLGNRVRSTVLAAILISGAATVARAELIPNKIPNTLRTFQSAGLHTPAAQLQGSQSVLQAAPDTHAAAPSVDAGHAPSTPTITYEGGLLTINAENARLSDILAALHSLMGTEIDLPPGASDERIWAHLGPGPARKILSDLLGNTDLNYVIQGSARDVDGIQSVTLTARAADGKSGTTGEVPERVDLRRPGRTSVAAAVTATETPDQDVAAPPAATPAATPATVPQPEVAADAVPPTPSPAPVEPQPVAAATAQGQSMVPESVAHPGPPATLNQEQMVQQLTNMYQQRKQLQQSQVGSTPN